MAFGMRVENDYVSSACTAPPITSPHVSSLTFCSCPLMFPPFCFDQCYDIDHNYHQHYHIDTGSIIITINITPLINSVGRLGAGDGVALLEGGLAYQYFNVDSNYHLYCIKIATLIIIMIDIVISIMIIVAFFRPVICAILIRQARCWRWSRATLRRPIAS